MKQKILATIGIILIIASVVLCCAGVGPENIIRLYIVTFILGALMLCLSWNIENKLSEEKENKEINVKVSENRKNEVKEPYVVKKENKVTEVKQKNYNSNNNEDNKDFIIENGVLKKYIGHDEVVIIPEGIRIIGKNAFKGCTSLTSVTIPDSVTKIGDYAFNGCSSLKNVKFPIGVTSLGDIAFDCCEKFESKSIKVKFTSKDNIVFEFIVDLLKASVSYFIKRLLEDVVSFNDKNIIADKIDSVNVYVSDEEVNVKEFGEINSKCIGLVTDGTGPYHGESRLIQTETINRYGFTNFDMAPMAGSFSTRFLSFSKSYIKNEKQLNFIVDCIKSVWYCSH